MEGESSPDKSEADFLNGLELELRGNGFYISEIPEGDFVQCDHRNDNNRDDCFDQARWSMEGSYYCSAHRGDGLRLLKKIDEGSVEFRKEQERKKEERRQERGWKMS